ncbi:MAG: 1,6-anhydro-N-acetylmuramyl-L-alanine amidase AmpD [Congregibacter sp.]
MRREKQESTDSRGGLLSVRWCPSPNFNERPYNGTPELIVIHNISLPPGSFGGGDIEAFFCNTLDCSRDPYYAALRGMQVSAHFLVDRAGAVTQFVSCTDRAWHAGVSSWCGRVDCNDFSIGIELEGTDTGAYSDSQYESLARLVSALRSAIPTLSAGAIVGHSDVAPGRKTDPGPAFNWERFRQILKHLSTEALEVNGLIR